MDKILGGRPATKPPLVIDTLNSSAETSGTDDDQESKKVDNDSVEDTLEDVESVSVAGTDVSGSSDGNNKTAVSKGKKPKKRSREDRLQSIMSGIMTQILDSQAQSDAKYLEIEEKRMRFEQEDKEREERMKKMEMDFQLRIMSMITQTGHLHASAYPSYDPY